MCVSVWLSAFLFVCLVKILACMGCDNAFVVPLFQFVVCAVCACVCVCVRVCVRACRCVCPVCLSVCLRVRQSLLGCFA